MNLSLCEANGAFSFPKANLSYVYSIVCSCGQKKKKDTTKKIIREGKNKLKDNGEGVEIT